MKVSITEEQIRDTAKKVFFRDGRFNATTQDIADAAGVARTLVHYYFRSRSLLFKTVVHQALHKMLTSLEFLFEDVPFKRKVENFIDALLREATLYPYLETYLVLQINQHFSDTDKMNFNSTHKKMEGFLKEVEQEVKQGTIDPIEPKQFILNLLSLISYPVAMQPLLKKFFQMNDQQFSQLLAGRKMIIMYVLFQTHFLSPQLTK